jgi:thymidylate synthase ThyX
MNKKNINAEIIADSVNKHGNRITTYVLSYPRIIHAELLTHRLFSRNAASSRAIPASKMIKDIEEDPFIPVAFQKTHSGMQGTEYFEKESEIMAHVCDWERSLRGVLDMARTMNSNGVTKQLVNRILEPFQWYTCIVTATEYDNFFELRCPQYGSPDNENSKFKSRKDYWKHYHGGNEETLSKTSDLDWLKINKGQGEIHISLLAEAMWDAMNESKPKELKAGEWHIPFEDNIDSARICELYKGAETSVPFSFIQDCRVKIATARCARVSYLNFEGKDDYEADIKLYDRLKAMGHMSPFEHCARAMSGSEMMFNARTTQAVGSTDRVIEEGWSGNFRGFVQLRKEIE